MIPAAFEYRRAGSVEEALRLLQEADGNAKLLAGGHSLLPMMKLRLSQPEQLIDIGRIPELRGIRIEGDRVRVGALTTHADVAAHARLRDLLPALAEAASVIGDLQVRNRGTVGGNLAHADPAADLPAAVLALDASLTLVGPQGERSVAAADFFLGPMISALGADEMVTEVVIPLPGERAGSAYEKFPHPASGYAVVGAAAAVGLGADGQVAWARVGITGAADCPYRARQVEERLAGRVPTDDALKDAADQAAEDGTMGSDLFASAEYRAHLCRVFARRALARAVERARNGQGSAG